MTVKQLFDVEQNGISFSGFKVALLFYDYFSEVAIV